MTEPSSFDRFVCELCNDSWITTAQCEECDLCILCCDCNDGATP